MADMMEDMQESDEYEILPMSPLRKLEKRVDILEEHTVTHRELKEMFIVAKLNQQSINEMVRLNRSMMEKISDIAAASSSMANKMGDFLSRIEVEELPEAKEIRGVTDFNERLAKLENRLNALIVAISPRVRKPAPRPGASRPIATAPRAIGV